MDGSQKLPQRWLLGAQQLLDQGRGIDCTALGIAAWIHYCTQPLPGRAAHVVDDPLSVTFVDLAGRFEGASRVDAVLDLHEVFPPPLSARPAFRDAVHRAYGALTRDGVDSLLHALAASN